MQCIMDEPVMQWASLALPAPQAMARNLLPADLGSELGCKLRPTSCHLEEKGNVIKCGFTLISSLCQPFNKFQELPFPPRKRARESWWELKLKGRCESSPYLPPSLANPLLGSTGKDGGTVGGDLRLLTQSMFLFCLYTLNPSRTHSDLKPSW